MGRLIAVCSTVLLLLAEAQADVYVVIYATMRGRTGHAGIAIDQYQIQVNERHADGVLQTWDDTVKTGRLTYFDLWPVDDAIPRDVALHEVKPLYYRLPGSSSERPITVESLCTLGVPHKEGYACDGLIRIRTAPAQDVALISYLDRQIDKKRPFDAWTFNCVDFVLLGLEQLLGKKIDAGETVLFRKSATPNRLYQVLRNMQGAEVIKNADHVTKGSFWEERVLPAFISSTERNRR